MKILLDECVPVQVGNALPGHEVHSATNPAWRGLGNGELLHLAEQQGFSLIVVADKNMRYQQDLSSRRIAILELWTNHRPTLERNFQYIGAGVEGMAPGPYLELTAPVSFPRNIQKDEGETKSCKCNSCTLTGTSLSLPKTLTASKGSTDFWYKVSKAKPVV